MGHGFGRALRSVPDGMRHHEGTKIMDENTRTVYPLGNRTSPDTYRPMPDVIGEVDRRVNGNTVLRIGRVLPGRGWEQTGIVVLTPDERETLRAALTDYSG